MDKPPFFNVRMEIYLFTIFCCSKNGWEEKWEIALHLPNHKEIEVHLHNEFLDTVLLGQGARRFEMKISPSNLNFVTSCFL